MPPDQTSEADAPLSARREWAWTAFAALLVAAFSLAFLFQDRQFFWNDDYQTYQLAGYRELARAWTHGEVPLLSPYSWFGGALAGEFQQGVFSVFLTAIALAVFTAGLPLPYAAATFSIVHLAVLSAGTFRLARVRSLAPNAALSTALIASLNGWIFVWGARQWFPALASFAWLPWFWWALERALRPAAGRWAFVPAGLFLYLAVTAGWPFTVLMLILLSAWLTARTLWRRRWLAPWPVAAAWLIGLGLSAPAWLMLLEYSAATIRGTRHWDATNPTWMIPPDGWLGLIFPSYFTLWDVWGHPKMHACVEMTGGLVPLAVLGATMLRRGRAFLVESAWEWGLLVVPVVLAVLPGLGNFQYPFRWLPLFFLVLGLLAGHALQGLGTEALPNFGAWAAALVLAVWGATLLLRSDPTHIALVHGACLLGVCLVWAVIGWRGFPTAQPKSWAPIAVVLLSCSFMYVICIRFAETPTWRVEDRLYDRPMLDADVRYMSFYARPDIIGERSADAFSPAVFPGMELAPGDTSMYAGVQIVNGYSPMGPRGLSYVCGIQGHGYFVGDSADRLLDQETGPDGMLQLMGVDGLIVADRFLAHQPKLEAEGWRPTADVASGRIFRRDGPPSPRVRALDEAIYESDMSAAIKLLVAETGKPAPHILMDSTPGAPQGVQRFATAQAALVEDGRNEAAAEVVNPSADQEALVVFSRPWYPGYRAECDGKPAPVSVLDLTMPAVRLPPGTSGRLVLRYRPRSLEIGGVVAAATAGILLIILMRGAARRLFAYSFSRGSQNRARAERGSANRG